MQFLVAYDDVTLLLKQVRGVNNTASPMRIVLYNSVSDRTYTTSVGAYSDRTYNLPALFSFVLDTDPEADPGDITMGDIQIGMRRAT